MKRFAALCLSLSLMGLSGLAFAHGYVLGGIKIGHPWSRAMPAASATGAVYLQLSSKDADKLLSASTPRADKAELHNNVMDNGVMRMREMPEGLALAAGSQIKLAPGGMHLMLMGLKQPLKAGERFPLTLVFEKAGSVTVEVAVEDVQGKAEHH